MKRRTFIQTSAAAAAGTQLLGGVPMRAFAPVELQNTLDEDDDRILIVVQMFGGNDGMNTIIPADDPEYYKIRPNISVAKADAANVLSRVYMHPALAAEGTYNMKQMLEDGRLAVINGIGYENPNLSHFRSTDIWLSGFNPQNSDKRLTDGWLGRFWADRIQGFPETLPTHPTAVQVGGTLSMLLQSPKGDVGIALNDPDRFFELGQGLSPDLDPMPEDTRYGREFNFIRLVAEQSDQYSSVVKDAFDTGTNTVSYDEDNGFHRQMQLVSRLISGGLKSKVYLVYLGGFDTHVQQQNDDLSGLHPFLLESLSSGVGLFQQDALQQGFADRVVGMTVSEFGRRPYENGSRGTDHGAAGVQFVWGNKVRAGVYGDLPDLSDLNSNGDLRYQYDFRRVYADVLETWFGGSPEDTEEILEDRFLPLGILEKPVSVREAFEGRTPVAVDVYPNPTTNSATLRWKQEVPASVTVELYGMDGRFRSRLYRGDVQPGLITIPVDVSTSGSYLCNVIVNGIPNPVPLNVVR